MSVLFSSQNIGKLEIKNRFVSSSTVECLTSEDNHLTEKYYRVYRRLAQGNVGLIIPGNYFISPDGRAVDKVLVIDNDGVIPELQKLTELVHGYDAKIIAQINHGGRQCDPKLIGKRPLSPSNVRDTLTGVRPRAMTVAEIEQTINDFAQAARRIKAAGFDGVQINAAHGYLVNQFLSARTNRRNDRWGGSLENRMRFLLSIYDRIRCEVGSDFPVLVKVNSEDFIKNGVTLGETLKLCRELDKRGIDAVEVSGGIKETGFTTTRGSIPKDALLEKHGTATRFLFNFIERKLQRKAAFSEGYFQSAAAEIKQNVKCPVIVVGGMRSKKYMQTIIENRQADFIAMSRPFIRQPGLVKLLEKTGTDEAVSCVNCNLCTVQVTQNYRPLRCYYSPNKK